VTQPSEGPPATGEPTCYRHPGRETWIRCQRCDRSICPDCMNDAAVGFQCPDCIRRGVRETRQDQALYGGRRSGDPRLTSYVLIGINVLVWLAIVATGGNRSRLLDLLVLMPRGRCTSIGEPSGWYPTVTDEAVCRGATDGDGTWVMGVADGAAWQLVTSAFAHVDIWHVGMNMLALAVLGPATEQILGRARFLAIYVAGALGGSTAVMWLSEPGGSTLGASGAVFGLLGALLVTFTKARRDTRWITQNLMIGVVITVVGWRFISWQGHLGGVLAGALAAAIVAYAPRQRRALVQWVGLAVLGVVLLGASLLRAVSLG
jgi:membrane associated rhomboid family serine protease